MSQYVSTTKKGNYIHDVGYDLKGKKYKRKVKFSPSLYIESNKSNNKLKTLFGKGTHKIDFDSLKEYNEYVYKNKNLDIHGVIDPTYQYINQTYKDNDINVKLQTWAIDIECVSDGEFPSPDLVKYEINSLAIMNFKTEEYFVLSLKDYDKNKNKIDVDPSKIKFKKCETEVELLTTFVKILQTGFPDILIGYFSEGFDFPYLIKRCIKVLGKEEANKMSPFGNVSCSTKKKLNRSTKKEETYYINKIDGIVLLDWLELYKKYTFEPRESYKLDFIASTELGVGKVDYEEFDNLFQMWQQNPQKFIDYNIIDVQLIKELDDKLNLIQLNSSIAYKANCNIIDMMGTLKPWEAFLYNELLAKNICLPPRRNHQKESYPGAYVKEPKKGLYEWIVSFDYSSLYPLTMCQYNISPETYIKDLTIDVNQEEVDSRFFEKEFKNPHPEHCLTAAGNYFRSNKKGIVPIIVEKLFNERKVVKKQMIQYEQEFENTKDKSFESKISQSNNEQMAIKILLNSLYGAMANKHFIFYDISFARSITLSAQLATRWIEKYIVENESLSKFNIKPVYCDTDSLYLECSHIVNTLLDNKKLKLDNDMIADFLDNFAKDRIQPIIKEGCDKLSKRMSVVNFMNMDREAICNSGVWTGKKKYALSVIDNEGVRYIKPKLKVTGIETVRSSTPAAIKPFLRNILSKILDKKNISTYIKECKKEYLNFTPEQLAFPRGANNFEKWYQEKGFMKGTPIGVKSAFVYNRYIDAKKLEGSFAKIQSGDKIKFIYIKQPNILNEEVVGFIRRMPEELKRYVDVEKMWYKSFYSVIESICKKINVEYEKPRQDVNSLF